MWYSTVSHDVWFIGHLLTAHKLALLGICSTRRIDLCTIIEPLDFDVMWCWQLPVAVVSLWRSLNLRLLRQGRIASVSTAFRAVRCPSCTGCIFFLAYGAQGWSWPLTSIQCRGDGQTVQLHQMDKLCSSLPSYFSVNISNLLTFIYCKIQSNTTYIDSVMIRLHVSTMQ
jgi:hypothetical protein